MAQRWARKILKILLWQVLALLLVLAACEGTLRIGGVISAWQHKRHAARSGTNAKTVLCAGDSFVYGIGGNPFPAQLEKILNERQSKIKFTVHNTGVPGTGTSQMLEALERQLAQYSPDYLIILSGASNTWLQFTLPDQNGFNPLSHLKLWRFWKLHRFMTALKAGVTPRFPKDCPAVVESEDDWLRNNIKDVSRAAEESPDGTDELRDYLGSADALFKEAERDIANRAVPMASQKLEDMLRLPPPVRKGDSAETRAIANEIQNNIQLRTFTMLAHLHRTSDSRKALNYFRKTVELRPDYSYGRLNMASIYRVSGDSDNFLKNIELLLKNNPSFVPAYAELAWYYYLKEDPETSEKYFAKAMALVPCSEETMTRMPFKYYELIHLLPQLEKSIPQLKLNPSVIRLKRLSGRLDRFSTDEEAVDALTEQDMLAAGKLSRQYKARLILSSYPERTLPAVVRAAKTLNAHYIDFVPLFKQRFHDRDEYISFDKDHCNSAGYRFMAERYADEILPAENNTTR